MSNRDDFPTQAAELAAQYGLSPEAQARIALELHNAYVAGQEAEMLARDPERLDECTCVQCVTSRDLNR